MAQELSKSQADRLGQRLRKGSPTEEDLWLLDVFRRSFAPAYEEVKRVLADELGLELSGRPQKTTDSIVAKLLREKTSLPRMQDISGCRIVVSTSAEQDNVVERIGARFPGSKKKDRRSDPSHGYRAVHVVVYVFGLPIEIQVRTSLQDGWAQLSEKMADLIGTDVKYGGGPEAAQRILQLVAKKVDELEKTEGVLAFMPREVPEFEELAGHMETVRADLSQLISDILLELEDIRRQGDDLSD